MEASNARVTRGERREVDVKPLRGDDLGHEEDVGRGRRLPVGVRPGAPSRSWVCHRRLERLQAPADEVLQPALAAPACRTRETRDVTVLERLDAAVDDLDERTDARAPVRVPRVEGGPGKRSSRSSTMATDSTYVPPSTARHGT